MNDHQTKKADCVVLTARFQLGTRVTIDDDKSIVATTVGICYAAGRTTHECCWFSNGSQNSAWIDEFRLKEAERV